MANEPNESYETPASGTQWGIIGHIKPISSPVPPPNWVLCDGSECLVDHYPALFAVLGARFGGDGVTTFALPDLSGEHHYAICFDGYFPLEGRPLPEWQLASALDEYIQMRVLSLRENYARGADPFYRHRHTSQLEPAWLDMQAQVLQDAYARGEDPLHRHLHMSELDPEWLERQAQVLMDAHARGGEDPMRGHPHLSELDPEWLEMQAQVLQDAYARGEDPLHRHTFMSDLDPEWLKRQVQVLNDAYARGEDPLHRHPHLSNLDPEWLERQAQVLKDGYARHSHPLERHPHVSEVDSEWLEQQAQVLADAYAHDHDPHHRHPPASELDEELRERAEQMMAAYARGEDPLAAPSTPEKATDDLKRIEGIGPKISASLQGAGITTFAQLAATEAPRLNEILDAAGLSRADPGTWPEQAKLAAAGHWDELAALQKELKWGRRAP